MLGEKTKPHKAKKFYYENYIRKVVSDNKKQMDGLMDEFYNYYSDYLTKKGIK